MGESTRMNQFDKIPKFTGDKNSDIIANFISSIQTNDLFLFYKYFKPHQTLNLVENNRKSYDIDVIHSSSVKKNNRKEGRNEEKERQTYRFFSG